ncbi:hypothetical protein DL95DRAFT_398152 [Leptodontidium sp. 2 PMI_412]|nr:hypothetical protein DL95DRAFT_398152 [Leptodontidium sp. 2 PMI_412]
MPTLQVCCTAGIDTSQKPPARCPLEARVQALEGQVQLWLSRSGQHTSAYGAQGSCSSATPTLSNSRQENEALGISDSPATDGSGNSFSQAGHQNGVPACAGYGPMLSQDNSVSGLTIPTIDPPHRASHSGHILAGGAPSGPSLANNNFCPADSLGYSYANAQSTLGNCTFSPTDYSGHLYGGGQLSLRNTSSSPADNLGFLPAGSASFSGDNHIAIPDNLGLLPADSEQFLGDINIATGHVYADQSLGTNQTMLMPPQGHSDLQLADNPEGSGYHDGDYMNSMFDFPAASMPSDTSVDMGYSILDINQSDVNHGSKAATPADPVSSTRALAAGPRVHRCVVSMHCHRTFARRADRDRHSLTHDRHSIRRYPCSFQGCERVGLNGFWRLDKLNEHRSKRGH